MVTYYTRYTTIDNIPILLSFGLGKEVAVNAIIDKPKLKEWKGCIEFERYLFSCGELRMPFAMEYKMADLGLNDEVKFDSTRFVRPKSVSSIGAHLISIERDTSDAKVVSEDMSDVISDTHTGGIFTRTVTKQHTE